ncbi:hypothetical protein AVEN_431-1 [Araneus ventricosus]|uniref:Uncharacterized protein n=1 Tax=Araneus ventricosus TaxID=182803 RepID=A0A4Y2VJE7_ARAVE|nr:hypothetical protein AVEN_431-1 [Araneus ventricosus]
MSKGLDKVQKLLLDISYSVLTAVCSSYLTQRDPGPTSHPRCLKISIKILRLYVRTEISFLRDDSSSVLHYAGILHCMVRYQKESFLYKLVKTFVERNKKLEVFIRRSGKLVDPVISRNAFMALTENLLLSVVGGRETALSKLTYLK